MSHPAKFVKKHPWETAGLAAATILTGGAAGIGPAAGLMGGGGSAGLLGALGGMGSEQAAALAAQNAGLGLGADIATLSAANTAGDGASTLGAKLASGASKFGKASKAAQVAGLLSQPQQGMPSGSLPPMGQVSNTQLYPEVGGPAGMDPNDPRTRELILALLRQQGGMA